VLTPTSSGTTVVAPVRPDYSFEIPDVPFGSYRAAVRPEGSERSWITPTIAVIRDLVADFTVDLGNNPFPELVDNLGFSIFAEGKETTITGVVTQRFTGGYFRMNVKDEQTGVVTPWALYVENYSLIPNVKPGETYTVQGTVARDGTNRLKAKPF
jgi:hypothetical protein